MELSWVEIDKLALPWVMGHGKWKELLTERITRKIVATAMTLMARMQKTKKIVNCRWTVVDGWRELSIWSLWKRGPGISIFVSILYFQIYWYTWSLKYLINLCQWNCKYWDIFMYRNKYKIVQKDLEDEEVQNGQWPRWDLQNLKIGFHLLA